MRLRMLLLACSLAWAGCGGPLQMTLVGDADMNSGGNTALVRVYELRSDGSFRDAQIAELWEDDDALLGQDVVQKHQFRLYPEESQSLELDLEKDVQFIGVAADLRQPRAEQWRRVLPVDELKGKQVRVRIGPDLVYLDTP